MAAHERSARCRPADASRNAKAGRHGLERVLTRWALVNADGTIADQSGGITLASKSTGGYYLDFGSSVEGHALVATIKYRNSSPANSDGVVNVAPCGIEGTTCFASGRTIRRTSGC